MPIKVHGQPLGTVTIAIAILTSVGGMIFGYDTGQISCMVLMRDFQDRFADIRSGCDETNHNCEEYDFGNVRNGLIVGLLSIGTLVGAILGAPLADYWGRRRAMTIESSVFIIGVLIQVTAFDSWEQFGVGRCIAGLGVGALSAAVPMYMSECVVAAFRGTAVACYQLMVTFGILMAYVWCYGTRPLNNDASWRIIVALGIVLALVLGIGVWFLPESPRWLMKQNYVEEARHSLERIRGAKSDFDQTIVEHDFLEIAKRIKMEQQTESTFWRSWIECFVGHAGTEKLVYRTFLGMIIQSLQQLTGANFFFYFGADIFTSVGIEDSYITQIILGAVNFGCTFFGLYVMENFGRRQPLIWGGIWQGCWLIVFAASATAKSPYEDSNIGKLMIVAACLFIASYASTYGPGAWIVTGETFPMRTRARQASLATAANWVWNFLISFFSPFIDNAISFRYGFVFAACNFAGAIFVFFFLYETAGLSLEAVDEMYSTKGLKPWQSEKWVPEGYEHRRDAMESSKMNTYQIEDQQKRFDDTNSVQSPERRSSDLQIDDPSKKV